MEAGGGLGPCPGEGGCRSHKEGLNNAILAWFRRRGFRPSRSPLPLDPSLTRLIRERAIRGARKRCVDQSFHNAIDRCGMQESDSRSRPGLGDAHDAGNTKSTRLPFVWGHVVRACAAATSSVGRPQGHRFRLPRSSAQPSRCRHPSLSF
jgi:hypothetical protein